MNACPYCGTTNADTATTCANCGASLVFTDPALPAGTLLDHGKYRLERVLGQGGFGITYAATELLTNDRVAIKELFPNQGATRSRAGTVAVIPNIQADYQRLRDKAINEARTLNHLRHPGIVQVKTVFDERNTIYIVMEYLEGETLEERLKRGALPEAEARAYLVQLLGALETIHAQSLYHRDLKPSNIMLTKSHGPVLIDFGTTLEAAPGQKKTLTSVTLTPEYAPLEQYSTHVPPTPMADLYALGATFYHALTGQLPPTANERGSGVALKPVRSIKPGVNADLATTLEQALEMHVSKRPQSAAAMRALLGTPSQTVISSTVLFGTANPPPAPIPGLARTVRSPTGSNQTSSVAHTPPKKNAWWLWLLVPAIGVGGWMVSIGIFGSSAPSPSSQNQNPAGGTATAGWRPSRVEVATDRLNVRAQPDVNASVVTMNGKDLRVERNEMVNVFDASNGWYEVEARGQRGWIRDRLTIPVAPEVDASELQRFLEIARTGGRVELREGVYMLPNALDLGQALEIVGAGVDRTFIVSNAVGATLRYQGSGRLAFSNLTLAHAGGASAAVAVVSADEIEVRDARFIGGQDTGTDPSGDEGDGLTLRGATRGLISGGQFFGNRWRGLTMHDSVSVRVEASTFKTNTGSGLAVYDRATPVVTGNEISDNGLAGVKVWDQSSPTLENNTLERNAKGGIAFNDASRGAASGNHCDANEEFAIKVESSKAQPRFGANPGCVLDRAVNPGSSSQSSTLTLPRGLRLTRPVQDPQQLGLLRLYEGASSGGDFPSDQCNVIDVRFPSKQCSVTIDPGGRYSWGSAWCATKPAAFPALLSSTSFGYEIDGTAIPVSQFWVEKTGICLRRRAILDGFQSGSSHELKLVLNISQDVSDGTEIFRAGRYELMLEVQVQ